MTSRLQAAAQILDSIKRDLEISYLQLTEYDSVFICQANG